MDLQIVEDARDSRNPVVRCVADGFKESIIDMAMLNNAVRFKQVDPNEISEMSLMQEAVYRHNKQFLKGMHKKALEIATKVSYVVGDVVIKDKEKMYVERVDENGEILETIPLWRHVASQHLDTEWSEEMWDKIQEVIGLYEIKG